MAGRSGVRMRHSAKLNTSGADSYSPELPDETQFGSLVN